MAAGSSNRTDTGSETETDPTMPRAGAIGLTLSEVTSDHYVLGGELARGGMGSIRQARDVRLDRVVAIKESLKTSRDSLRRFEREARIAARLQHPSIVNVYEAGVWPSGTPFYAMKLVNGRSLATVVEEARSLEERLALLPNVLAVADAMAYAHGERIIHRDLKPSNILVGDFGETVVIDWGLAKDLDDAKEPEIPDSDTAPSHETAAGNVLGTPAYMPPEQADGLPVDERADVFGIGGILFFVLSEKAPRAGSATEVLDAVRLGPPVSIATHQQGLPPDLVAIVDRAMAKDPVARYPTARELAEDLRRYLTGKLVGAHRYQLGQLLRRWLRRHRGAVAVGTVALAVLLGAGAIALARILGAERVAREQQVLAEGYQADAEGLVDFMLKDLVERLKPIGHIEILDVVIQRALAHYERRPPAVSTDDRRRRALALEYLGNVSMARGNSAAGLTAHRAALSLREALAAGDPGNPTLQRDRATSHRLVGRVLKAQGNSTAALVSQRTALSILDGLATASPDDGELQRDRAAVLDAIGTIYGNNDRVSALAAFRTSLSIREALAAADPSNTTVLRELSFSHDYVGDELRELGDLAGALAYHRAGMTIAEKLWAADRSDVTLMRDVAVGHGKIGLTLKAQGDAAGALTAIQASLALREKLVKTDPENVVWQRDLAVTHSRLGDLAMERRDARTALGSYRAYLEIAQALAARDPADRRAQADLARAHTAVGEALLAGGDAGAALESFRAGQAIREKMFIREPSDPSRIEDLEEAHLKLGQALEALARGRRDRR